MNFRDREAYKELESLFKKERVQGFILNGEDEVLKPLFKKVDEPTKRTLLYLINEFAYEYEQRVQIKEELKQVYDTLKEPRSNKMSEYKKQVSNHIQSLRDLSKAHPFETALNKLLDDFTQTADTGIELITQDKKPNEDAYCSNKNQLKEQLAYWINTYAPSTDNRVEAIATAIHKKITSI